MAVLYTAWDGIIMLKKATIGIWKKTMGRKYLYHIGEEVEPVLLEKALDLRNQVYLERNFIDESWQDKYHESSEYIIVTHQLQKSQPLVMLRLTSSQDKGILPILDGSAKINKNIYTKLLKSAHEMHVVEVGSFVKSPQEEVESMLPASLLHEALLHSKKKGHKLWVMAVGESIFPKYKKLLGSDLIVIGGKSNYPGEDIIPCLLIIDKQHAKEINLEL